MSVAADGGTLLPSSGVPVSVIRRANPLGAVMPRKIPGGPGAEPPLGVRMTVRSGSDAESAERGAGRYFFRLAL